ncbi:Phosphoglycerate mutase-like protein [Thalictrum thalictroides]|uniref:Phosphoglycerate mutase-like protein n=1 Tax=Thalictrum thalictroides TaxID=46969 RepID=A0A7J6VGK8_THATH|nr:Phosphoglycerate mutase-like protein [Thalictrum thalictroides]
MATTTDSADSSNGVVIGSDSSDYAEIVVVRHGETTWNCDGRLQGHLDAELNEFGIQQALEVADRLSKETKVSAVYASDLKRAFETAQKIAKSCGGLEVVQDKDLRERHLGDLQGLVLQEAAKTKPEAYEAFVSGKRDQEIPGGGESLDQVSERCTSALQKIAQNHKGI